MLLVLSGGFGMGPVAEILAELDKAAGQFQTLVVTGRNEELRRELAAQDRKHPTHVLGFSTNMHELMAVADLIITKPGGLTSSEALAMGKPLFILNPIPGQEAANSDFLLEHGAAAKANRVEDLPYRIGQLLGSKKLGEMGKAAKSLGRANAAQDICREVLSRSAVFKSGAVTRTMANLAAGFIFELEFDWSDYYRELISAQKRRPLLLRIVKRSGIKCVDGKNAGHIVGGIHSA